MLKKLFGHLFILSLTAAGIVAVSYFFIPQNNSLQLLGSPVVHAAETSEEDELCDERMEGTMSAESCVAACTMPNYTCALAVSYDADEEEELKEDLDCYGCRKYVCADFGRLDARGRDNCDIQPDKKSVAAPPLADGTPCWQCVDKKDQCDTKWPGSTDSASCQAVCPKNTHACIKVGTHNGVDCFQCRGVVPPPPPPPLCKDWGLLIAAQCKTCKDPTPICAPAGVAASNGPCFQCVKKPKIKCSDFGFKEKCKCAKDETIKWHWVSKITPSGLKVFKKCCECVKKPEQCQDISLYTKAECKKACKKPGQCVYSAKTKKGIKCYNCVSPTTCEEKGYESSCKHCTDAGMDCVDVSTDEGVKCKQCIKKKKVEDDQDQVAACRYGGLPGACPGTCSEGLLCIGRPGPCHMCMKVKSIEITWVIIVIDTPRGRVILDKKGEKTYMPSSVMALAQGQPLGDNYYSTAAGVFKGGGVSSGSLEEIADWLIEGLNSKRKFSQDCFDNVETADPQIEPPVESEGGGAAYGNDPMHDLVIDGPLLTCGTTDGRKGTLAVMDASGSIVTMIKQSELKENPQLLKDALQQAGGVSLEYEKVAQQISGLQKANAKTVASNAGKMLNQAVPSSPEEGVVPNDPFYHFTKKKKKKLFGILGSSKKAKVTLGSGIKMGGVSLGAGTGKERKEEEASDQWGLKRIGYLPRSDPRSAWNIVDGSQENVLVAVIDSGFDYIHEDTPQYVWTNKDEIPNNGKDDDGNGYIDDVHGWNFLDNNNDLTDYNGHGTFVAGIIAAKRNNGIGIAGINPGAVIMPLKIVNRQGETNDVNVYRAIHYAVDKGARIINVSLGNKEISKIDQAALNYAHAHGVFVAVASGNNGWYTMDVGPAANKNAFAVGAIDMDGLRSTISSYGPNNALLGPGELIYSIRSQSSFHKRGVSDPVLRLYHTQSGTSFSTPMVAATASLMLVKNPKLTPNDIEDILTGTADDMDDPGWDDKTGAGLINATESLKVTDQKFLNVKITKIRINRDKKEKLESVDVFATVRGGFDHFTISLGKGKHAKKFNQVAGPFRTQAEQRWVVRLNKDQFKGSKNWVVQLKVADNSGGERLAHSVVELNRK